MTTKKKRTTRVEREDSLILETLPYAHDFRVSRTIPGRSFLLPTSRNGVQRFIRCRDGGVIFWLEKSSRTWRIHDSLAALSESIFLHASTWVVCNVPSADVSVTYSGRIRIRTRMCDTNSYVVEGSEHVCETGRDDTLYGLLRSLSDLRRALCVLTYTNPDQREVVAMIADRLEETGVADDRILSRLREIAVAGVPWQ